MRVKVRSSSLIHIRDAVLREPGCPLRVESLELEGPRQDEVLVRLVASGICHTDMTSASPAQPARLCWDMKARGAGGG